MKNKLEYKTTPFLKAGVQMSLEEVYLQPTGWWRGSLGSPESEMTTVVGQRLQDRVTWPGIGKLRASHRGAGGPHYRPGTAAGLASREPSTRMQEPQG